ncbi:sulfur carrier protein ThiS [Saccharibacillus sacchari]|uniref:sulfur carrier protein ThiS n=1 Tax=Saccharibacillus sacchari TaxID=456493 RepID=UPI0004B3EE5D|nr:sulfur carrier protein ThiS [Saccharibacillus sacchari]
MAELTINGKRKELDADTLADVVELLGLGGRPVVAEVNGEVVASEKWAETQVASGMKIELVHFVGGG